MVNLTQANCELFKRPPDECFESLADLSVHCCDLKERSRRIKEASTEFRPMLYEGRLSLKIDGNPNLFMTDWSFSQLCSIAGAAKDTVNRLNPETAAIVLDETLRQRTRDDLDMQALVYDNSLIRAVNGEHYKRLWNADLVAMLQEFAVDFTPPQKGFNGATGLYAGEQDMFAFMIDPAGWSEIGSEAFAPGFFVWNSEVGKRTVGISTFWFQAVCANHIVWDATEVTEFTRKHTGRVRDSLSEIRTAIETLVQKRDERKDGFARVVTKAMETAYGQDAEEVEKLLTKAGITKSLTSQAIGIARKQGRFTIWSIVDALTQLARESQFAGNRTEAEAKASALLSLVDK
jgi:Domain of unknown function (DUF932)